MNRIYKLSRDVDSYFLISIYKPLKMNLILRAVRIFIKCSIFLGDFYPKKKRKQILESKLKKNLNDTVSKVLGCSLDTFARDILDNEKFNEMMQKKIEFDKNNAQSVVEESKQSDTADLFINLYPKT